MSTYLKGDYVAQLQPFQPDLNLYSTVLQTKQTQYDTAWKSLNNIYSQYFYSDLSRESNIERKEEVIKNITFNLQRISGLDLSLDQNVSQAMQVFKPFYEDQYMMKDMAWTKNFNNQKGKAERFKMSKDEKERDMYWDGGVRAMDYLRKEFQDASDDESLNFGNAQYTPYVNVIKEAQKIAKEAGLSMETPTMSPDGRYWVYTKNGEQLMEPLNALFEAHFGNDPAVQAVYKTQAYLDRKDYAYGNAAQFNGDVNAAEMSYLQNAYGVLAQENIQRYNQLAQDDVVYTNKIADIEKQISNGNKSPELQQALAQLKQGQGVNAAILKRYENIKSEIEGNSTPNTTGSANNPYGDIESLRWKVDNGMAAKLMQKDLGEAAQIYAFRDMKVRLEEDQFALNTQKHQFAMQEGALRNKGLERAAQIRANATKEAQISKYLVETAGTHDYDLERYQLDEDGRPVIDPITGQPIPNPNFMGVIEKEGFHNIISEVNPNGSTDRTNLKVVATDYAKQITDTELVPHLRNVTSMLADLKDAKQITNAQIKEMLGGYSLDEFTSKINSGEAYNFLKHKLGRTKLSKINNNVNSYLYTNKSLSAMKDLKSESLTKFAQYQDNFKLYLEADSRIDEWKKESSKVVKDRLSQQGYEHVNSLYNNGVLRSFEQFEKDMMEKGYKPEVIKRDTQITVDGKRMTVTNQNYDKIIEIVGNSKLKSRGVYSGANIARKAMATPEIYREHSTEDEFLKANKLQKDALYVQDISGKFIKVQKDDFSKAAKKLGEQYLFSQHGYNVPRTGENTLRNTYDEMVKAAAKAYTNDVSTPPPGLSGFGSGIHSERQRIGVSPKGNENLQGKKYFREFGRDIYAMDFGDVDRNYISFSGAGPSAKDKIKEGLEEGTYDAQKRGELLRSILMDFDRRDMSNFQLGSARTAFGNATKGAMTIYLTKEDLDKYVEKKDKDDNITSTGYLTQEEAQDALVNGITVISDHKSFKNGLFEASGMDPLQAVVDYESRKNRAYTWTDPFDSRNTFSIKRDNYGLGEYRINSEVYMLNPVDGTPQTLQQSETHSSGNNLLTFRNGMIDYVSQIRQQNAEILNRYGR